MAIFCIADTHLSLSVPKQMDKFGHRWLGYTEKLTSGWCETVTEADTVIIPGDISWGLTLEEAEQDLLFLHRLPGKKIIGRGNNDFWWQSRAKIEKLFARLNIDSISLLHHNAFEVEDKIICGSRGWFSDSKNAPDNSDLEKVSKRELLRAEMSFKAASSLAASEKELIAFFHFPPVYKDFISEETIQLMKAYGIRRCYYGHIHGQYDVPSSFEYGGVEFIIVSADYLNFKPYLIV